MKRILIIEDETILANNIGQYLEKAGYHAKVATTGNQGLIEFEKYAPDLVVLDVRLGDLNGIDIIPRLRQQSASIPIIMMTAYGSIDIAVEAIKCGANEFLTKPFSLGKLRTLIANALSSTLQENSAIRKYGYMDRIIGESPAISELKHQILQISRPRPSVNLTPPVLILGESGTGKELVAQALHYNSPRAKDPFIEINCSAIPDTLVESELFGHVKGAYTGASTDKTGLFVAADGGTLFLDEIAEMPLNTQLKLLKVIEDKEVRPLGATHSRKVDVRIIAATNRPLEQLIENELFREDLYYRLCIIQLETPPLRKRGDDILLLANHFLNQLSPENNKVLTKQAQQKLLEHNWPGNVRELRNLIEKTVLLFNTSPIKPEHLLLNNRSLRPEQSATPLPDNLNLSNTERGMLLQALVKTNWNISAAARILGISRDTLRYRIKRLELKKTR